MKRALVAMFALIGTVAVAAGTWFDALIERREERQAEDVNRPVPLPDFGAGNYTVTAWFRTERDGTIFAKTAAEGAWIRDGKSLFIREGRMCYDVGWVGCVTGRTPVNDGKWHHVAFCGGSPQRIYIDGTLDASGNLSGTPEPARSVLKIGWTSTNFPGGDNRFRGQLDDLRVYARRLSDKEAHDLYQSGREAAAFCQSCGGVGTEDKPSTDGGLLLYLPFDGSLDDVSGSLNHGTPSGKTGFAPGPFSQALALDGGYLVVRSSQAEAPDAVLWRELAAEFRDAESRQQMAWERDDGIWGVDWRTVDYPTVARRYAGATRRPSSVARQAGLLVEKARAPADLEGLRRRYYESKRYGQLLERLSEFRLDALRDTIRELHGNAATQDALLSRLDAVEARAAAWQDGPPPADEFAQWQETVEALRRDALVTHNPLFDFDKLVFVKRLTYSANHYYTEFINSNWTPGGNICVLDLRTGEVNELVPELKDGVFERFDVSFDATRIVFAWKGNAQQGYRIYEVSVDPVTGQRAGELRQLTFPQENEEELVRLYRARPHYHHGTDDMHPCYLPDGDIVFISTRCQYGILCDAPDDFTTTVLYRMKPDGSSMRKLSNSSVSEASPVILPDGRIMYTRWEYLDKGAVSVKCLWSMRQDGSASAEVYANDISLPPTFIYGRPIPGTANQYVVLGTPHCPQNGIGTVIRLDMTRDIRTRDPMTYMTPYADIQAEGGFSFRSGDGPWQGDGGGKGPLFKDPYPLSAKYFLVSHKPAGPQWRDPTSYDLYLLNESGDVSLLYRDPRISCWLPYPLKPRVVPPVLTSPVDSATAARGLATCVVTDVYHGMEDVARGTIKHIRVLEQVPRPWATRRRWGGDGYDQQHACITKDTHLGLKVQHGVVPVEEDGSAHFLVPAERNVFLQALDENYMAVQTERTFVNYVPGEKRSCVGCHEKPDEVAATLDKGMAIALTRPPSTPGPQPGETRGARPLDYETDVQPVWDKHCIRCHSGKEPKAGLSLSGQRTALFCVSYEQLIPERRRGPGRERGKVDLVGPTIGENHPKTGNVHYLPSRSLGSHASILVAMLAPGKVQLRNAAHAEIAARLATQHNDVKLTREELIRVTNWVDTNAQYYGMYWGRKGLQHKDHPNFRPVPTFERAASMVSQLPEEER